MSQAQPPSDVLFENIYNYGYSVKHIVNEHFVIYHQICNKKYTIMMFEKLCAACYLTLF